MPLLALPLPPLTPPLRVPLPWPTLPLLPLLLPLPPPASDRSALVADLKKPPSGGFFLARAPGCSAHDRPLTTMLNSLRNWWGRGPLTGHDLGVFNAWADTRGFALRRARDTAGCVLEGPLAGRACRIEWGEPLRPYVDGMELRLIAEVGLPRDLQLLLLNLPLMQAMEKQAYEQLIDDVQTRADSDMAPEMRGLVVLNRAGPAELGRLRERYGAVCNRLPWLSAWLAGSLNDALAATLDSVPAEQPVVLSLRQARLCLRTAMLQPDAAGLVQWVSVFEHALREAVRTADTWRDGPSPGGPQTEPYAWPSVPAASPPVGTRH